MGLIVTLVVSPLLVVMIAVFGLLDAWVITHLWGWFIVPLGVGQVGMAHAYGISCIVSLLTHQYTRQDSKEKWYMPMASAVLRPFIALLCGWIAHKLMVG